MGFFDRLDDIWSDWDEGEAHIKQSVAGWKRAGSGFISGAKSLWAGTVGLALAPTPWGTWDKAKTAWKQFGSDALNVGTGALQGVFSLPLLDETAHTFLWAQNEIVKRPLGTAFLRVGDWAKYGDAAKFFSSGEEWQQAYNDTRRVSMGQAFAYGLNEAVGGEAPDPRTAQGYAVYTSKEWNRWRALSGAADAIVDIFADPTIGAMKAAKAAKIAGISRPVTAKSIEAGLDSRIFTSGRSDALLAQAVAARESGAGWAHFDRVFAPRNRPSAAATAPLYLVAGIKDPALRQVAWNQTLLSALGDTEALARLRKAHPNVAQEIARGHSATPIRDAANAVHGGNASAAQRQLYDGAVNGDLAALLVDDVDAVSAGLQKAMEADRGVFAQAQGSLVGQFEPRVSLTGRWRAGVHQALVNGGPRRAFFGVKPRDLMPTATYARMIASGMRESAADFAANAERASYVPQHVRNRYTEEYARATTPEARERIAAQFQDEGFELTARAFGYTAEAARAVLPEINRYRTTATQLVNTSRRYVPGELRREAERAMREGYPERAQALSNHAKMAEEAIARGDQPAEIAHILDQDGNPIQIALDWKMPGVTEPVTQGANAGSRMIPMMDFRALESALWWSKRGPVGQAAYRGVSAATGLLDAASQVWKIATLLRPGYVWRVLSDDELRQIARFGAASFLMNTAVGGGRSVMNNLGRAAILAEEVGNKVRGRGAVPSGLDPNAPVTAPVIASRETVESGLAALDDSGRRVYGSHADMMADGAIGIRNYVDLELARYDRGVVQPTELSAFIQQYKTQRGYTRAKLERDVADWALWRTGRDAYRAPQWQTSLVETVSGGQGTRADVVARGPHAGTPTVVADPFTGTQRTVDSLDGFEMGRARRVPFRYPAEVGASPADEVYRFIHANMDELTMPDRVMVATLDNADNMVLAVGRATDQVAGAVSVGSPRRLSVTVGGKTFYGNSRRNVRERGMESPLRLTDTDGKVIEAPGLLAGEDGAKMRGLLSSRGDGGAYADYLSKIEYERLLASTGNRSRTIDYGGPDYAANYERTVNSELAGDQVAQMFLRGKSLDDVLLWLRNTRDGGAYLANMGPMQARYFETVATIGSMVDKYAPVFVGREAEGVALRNKILKREATVADLESAAGHAERMPAVTGAEVDVALGKGAMGFLKNKIDSIFKVMSDMPIDALSRFPFANEAYARHMKELGEEALEHATITGGKVGVEGIQRITQIARERTLADVKKTLYDNGAQLDLARAGRMVVPFSTAIGDSYTKWGAIIRDKPWVGYNLWKAYTAPDRAGLVEDETGAHLRWIDGKRIWFRENPKTGEEERLPDGYMPSSEFILFQLPEGYGPLPKGAEYRFKVNKDSLNTFLNLATAGPIVAMPLSEFALDNPEFSENYAVKKFALPFGPSHEWYKAAIPGTVRTFYEAWVDEDGDTAQSTALAVYQTEWVNYAQGRRKLPPTPAEAREQAAGLRQLRWMSYFMGVSGQVNSPYQPYADYYRQLQAEERGPDDPTVDEQFMDEMGEEFFVFSARVSQSKLGLPADIGTHKKWQELRDLAAEYPDLAPWIVGAEAGGEFNRAVYEAQFREETSPGSGVKLRSKWKLEDSVEEVNRRAVWLQYTRLQDRIDLTLQKRGLLNLQAKGAADLRLEKAKFVREHQYEGVDLNGQPKVSAWYEQYSTTDRSRMLRNMTGMLAVAKDPRLQGRDDIRGFLEYMSARENTRKRLKALGVKSIDTKKATPLRARWDRQVQDMKANNLAFAELYSRYLENDDLTTDVTGSGISFTSNADFAAGAATK